MSDKEEKIDYLEHQLPMFSVSMLIAVTIFLLGTWGCLAIYSATSFGDDPFHYAGRQLLWLGLGMTVMLTVVCIPIAFFKKYLWLLSIAVYIPLALVLIFGIRINGMRGWFSLGPALFQPSELAKAFFLLVLCRIGTSMQPGIKRFLIMFGVTMLWVIPVMLEPDFGTAAIYLLGFVGVYWLIGGKIRYLLIPVPLGMVGIVAACWHMPYLLQRLKGFWDPQADPTGSGWHIRQFQFTLARGGLTGSGSGRTIWSNSYLPLAHSDSIFATLSESVGVVGALPVVFGFLFLTYLFYRLALKCKDQFERVFIMSVGVFFTAQALVHISVNVTLLPPTGLTLPLLSYGGSSVISIMVATGIALGIGGRREAAGDLAFQD
jgi:cell division protein FtsW